MMKILISFALFFLIAIWLFVSCKKNRNETSTNQPQAPLNHSPVARAGADQSFTLQSCAGFIYTELDGSGSTDPENKIARYYWRKISGPAGPVIWNPNRAKTIVDGLSPGEYAFDLTVVDDKYAASADTVLISVKGVLTEYNLDVVVTDTFRFVDNKSDILYYYGTTYYDETVIQGKAIFTPLGELTVYFSEQADTAASNYAGSSHISIYLGNINSASISGTTTINLKKLIQQGGGAFSGTLIISDGSAMKCKPDVLKNLAPLAVHGSIDTATRKVNFSIKGKTYF